MGKVSDSTGGTPAIAVLRRAGVAHRVRAYQHNPRSGLGYGPEAAAALGMPPERVFKTLMARIGDQLVTAIVPVNASLDLKALAAAANGKKAAMAAPADAQRATGYVVGGISPLGQKRAHRTVIDASAREFETMLVSAGARGLDVELAPADLAALTGAAFAPIAKTD
ncbi:MAG: Cys-tRNA(Pro) deacylase [Bifidobacteriaceae bacterium]|nr:Cys-tRNA(Pro) deacylase [Bifidobacteriaceae bacterium]